MKGTGAMNWIRYTLLFFRNVLIGVLLGAAALGLFGFLLAGSEGAVNGAYWGAVLGLIGGFFSGLVYAVRFWSNGENIILLPEWSWFIKKEEQKKDL